MKVFSAEQFRQWDAFTIEQQNINSIELMERAAEKCVQWLQENISKRSASIFCGKGNNGGDGLAIARLLYHKGYSVEVFILNSSSNGSDDFKHNQERLKNIDVAIRSINSPSGINLSPDTVIIDALFGTGLKNKIGPPASEIIKFINETAATVVSIDMPSGLMADEHSISGNIIEADHTLTFGAPKTALLMQENASYIGTLHVLDIGLSGDFDQNAAYELLDEKIIRQLYKPRNAFAHKGNFGHALLLAGSEGKMGAALLTAKACLRSGVGLLSCCIPQNGNVIMQTAVPEAMTIPDVSEDHLSSFPITENKYTCIGVGPGIGQHAATKKMLAELLQQYRHPMVIDADALNIIASENLLEYIPAGSIITPHPKEFERLFGPSENDFQRIKIAKEMAETYNIIIVLKGHHSFIASPEPLSYFNSTGNAGMAKGGSGDVLTGIITALVCQQYDPVSASIVGVYLHGLAGDIAAELQAQETMLASDIIEALPLAWQKISG